MVAAVDVHDFACRGRAPVREQDARHFRDRCPILAVPPERRPLSPGALKFLEARDALCGHRPEWPGRQRIDADLMLAQVSRQVPGDRFEGGFAHAHPVVEGPCLRRVIEVEGDDAATVLCHQRAQRLGHSLERVGARVKGGLNTLPRCGQEVAAQRVGRRIGDGMDEAVEPAPALFEGLGQRIDLLLVVHVHLQDLRGRLHPARTLLRQAHDPAETGQHDVGALPLRHVGDRVGDAGWG